MDELTPSQRGGLTSRYQRRTPPLVPVGGVVWSLVGLFTNDLVMGEVVVVDWGVMLG